MKQGEKEFIRGITVALSIIADVWGERHMAQMALHETGFTKQDMVTAGCEQADIDKIFVEPDAQESQVACSECLLLDCDCPSDVTPDEGSKG